jgi:hypothetical protein
MTTRFDKLNDAISEFLDAQRSLLSDIELTSLKDALTQESHYLQLVAHTAETPTDRFTSRAEVDYFLKDRQLSTQ